MSEKFLKLSKGLQTTIVLLSWVLTVVSFVGCLLVKEYFSGELYFVEIIQTCIGLLFCVVSICLTILVLTLKKDEQNQCSSFIVFVKKYTIYIV